MGFGILLEQQRRVFLAQLGDRAGELDLVLAVLRPRPRGDRPASAFRFRHGRRRIWRWTSRSPVANGSSRASATRSPACAALRLICLSPHSAKMPPMRPSRPPVAMQHRAIFQRTAQHPRQRKLAAMAAMDGLEHLHHRVAARRQAGTRRRRLNLRHIMAHRLQQPAHAIVAVGRADQHRHHQAFRQFAPKAAEHFVACGSISPSSSSIRCSS